MLVTVSGTIGFWLAAGSFALGIQVDRRALDALRRRDPEAFRELVARHHGVLVGLAQTITRNRATAEDVAQDTWLAVFARIGDFEGRSELSTWIIAILLNKARSVAKREGRYVALAPEKSEDEGTPGVSPERFAPDGHWASPPPEFDGLDPERIFAGRELWSHVRASIEALPPAQKAVMLLRDVEGKNAAETCRLLEISAENQRVLLHRGRTKVRSVIEKLLMDPMRRAGALA